MAGANRPTLYEAGLKTSERRLRAITETEPECIKILSGEGRLLEMNPAGLAMLEADSLAEAQRCPLLDFIAPECRADFVEMHKKVMGGERATLKFEVVGLKGTRRWLETRAAPLRDDAGEVRELLSVTRDVTERRQAKAALRENEERLFLATRAANIGLWDWNIAENRVWFSPEWKQQLGYRDDELVSRFEEWESRLHPEDKPAVLARLEASLREPWPKYQVEFRLLHRNGAYRWIYVDAELFRDEQGKPLRMLGCHLDITERKEQSQRITRLSRIQAVLSGINSAIVRIRDRQELFKEACRIAVEHGRFSLACIGVLDLASGKIGLIAHEIMPAENAAGVESPVLPAAFLPVGPSELALRETKPAIDNDIERTLAEISVEHGSDSMSIRRTAMKVGAKAVIALPLFLEGRVFGIMAMYGPERNFFDDEEVKLLSQLTRDISFGLEFIAKEARVDYLAYYDALTGLPNRSLFFDRLSHQLGTAARDRSNVALVLMDLDRFRLINDTLGRQAGDALINAVAQRIKETFRDEDTVARVGADSFAVAISGHWGTADAARVLESHNRQLFSQPFLIGKEELRMSASAGIALHPGDGESPETLFANAEAALKKAKSSGEHLLFYSPEMNAHVTESLRLENRLRRALENGEMVLWYQPKVSVKTRMVTGFEALMRWQDPETGMVPPALFIPLMEQTGLILEAGRWALMQVARDCALWSRNGINPPRVAVNVSPIQLRQKDFVATVMEAADKAAAAGSMLDLEITESVIMENVEAIIPKLQTIRGLGVEISVDDFGTGYSSLAYIARLPIQDLKIDRSFIVGMTQNEDSLSIVRSVVSLAHSLRLNVVAEGVETEEQAALLLQLGCDQMQGYLVSRPVAPDQVPALLSLDNGLGRKGKRQDPELSTPRA